MTFIHRAKRDLPEDLSASGTTVSFLTPTEADFNLGYINRTIGTPPPD